MEKSTLKYKATLGFLWNSLERFSLTIGQFIITVILARILDPEDFGLIGMLSVFISISQVFIFSGMGSALIQKQDRTDLDFSTVFIINLSVSLFFYIILFFLSSNIAGFYGKPQLDLINKVLGLNLIINAFGFVQRIKLEILLNFKDLAKINIVSLLLGGSISILLSIKGFGVWSLVILNLSTSLFTVIGLYYKVGFLRNLQFSKNSFRGLFRFASNLLIAGVYSRILQESYNVVIGKYYSATQLGYVTQASKLADVSAGTLSSVLQKVTFPLLATLQGDNKKIKFVFLKVLKITAFLVFPLMVIISILSEPLVVVIFGDKWLMAVPLLKILALSKIFYPLSVINMNILKAIGRSDLFLKIDLSKLPFFLLIFLITIPISLNAIILGMLIFAIFEYVLNSYLPGRLYDVGIFVQIKELLPFFISSILMAIVGVIIVFNIDNYFYQIIICPIVSIITYLISCYFFKVEEITEIKQIFSLNRK